MKANNEKASGRLDIFTLKFMLNLTVRFYLCILLIWRKRKVVRSVACPQLVKRETWVYWTKLFFILFIVFYKRYILILLARGECLDAVIISDPGWLSKSQKALVCRNKADKGTYLHPVKWSLTAEGPLLLRASHSGGSGEPEWTRSLSVEPTQTHTVR